MGRGTEGGRPENGGGGWFGSLVENVISLPLCQTRRGNKSWCDYKMCFIFISLFSLGRGMGSVALSSLCVMMLSSFSSGLCGGHHGQCVLQWLLWLSWNPLVALTTSSCAISGAHAVGASIVYPQTLIFLISVELWTLT